MNYLNQYLRKCQVYYQTHHSKKPVVKVHGLLRTGTNYITSLIDMNFNAFCLNSEEEGWKHGPCNYTERYYFIFLVKDPYSWLISFKEWEEIHLRSVEPKSLKDFMIDPLTHEKLKLAWNAENPLDAWNAAIASWNGYSSKNNTIFIRYEDLLTSFDDVLMKIQDKFAFEAKLASFKNIEKRSDNWKTPTPRKKMDLAYYKKKLYMDLFGQTELELMRLNLDEELIKRNGYNIL